MSARLNPRLGWALLGVMALTGFVALQPAPDDELAVDGANRAGRAAATQAQEGRAATDRPTGQAQPAAARAQPASRGASTPSPQQARELAGWAMAWQARASEPWSATRPEARWSWASQQPPPPPPPPVQEAAEPMAPSFPYAWVGRYVDDAPRAVIAGPNRTWVLRQGDVIDGQWRLGAVAERQLTVTYLPLNQDQTVALK
jgi:hypothetical protein